MRAWGKGLLLALTALYPALAAAAPATPEPSMDFSFQREDYRKYGLGLFQIIHANGAINDGTVDKLKVFVAEHNIGAGGEIYLNSATGNRLEGMRLGRLIRDLGLMTHIGNTDPNEPGSCVSACAFAYMGGTFRFMNQAATFGVHRFYRSQGQDQEFTLEEAPAVAQAMTDFMRDMGVSPTVYKYMSAPTIGEIVLIDKPTLMNLDVVNDGVISAEWLTADNSGLPYIRGNLENYQGVHSLSLVCDRQSATMKGIALMQAQDTESLRRTAAEEGVFIDNARVAIHGQFTAVSPKKVKYIFPISPQLALRMAEAPQLGIYVQPSGIIYHAGFQIQQTLESHQLIRDYNKQCFGTQVLKDAENL